MARPSVWMDLNPLDPRMLKKRWPWPGGSGEEDCLKSLTNVLLSPLGERTLIITQALSCFVIRLVDIVAVILEKKRFDSRQRLNPLHPRILWAKVGWNWPYGSGEEIFKSCHFFHYVAFGMSLSPFETNVNSLHPRVFCAKFIETEETKMWKIYDNDDYDDYVATTIEITTTIEIIISIVLRMHFKLNNTLQQLSK